MTERSTAIVLFTDLEGSTELRSRLGEDAAEALREQHDSLVVGAVEATRGTIVKNLGDGFMATFAGAADAVGAAVAIQQAIERHNRSRSTALGVRIGISAGDVVIDKGDCFGTPVIEASRLCGAAQGGQILASEIVRWMARSGGTSFTPVGALELKGLPEPVPTVEVGWEPVAQSSVPLPPFLTDIGRIFVGRDGEVERLGQLWKEAAAGQLRTALLAGEPGVGKTRLAAELARTVHDEGAIVLAGRCDEDLGVPYQPFVEALRHFVDNASARRNGSADTAGNSPGWCPSWPIGFRSRIRFAPIRRPSATGCSTPWLPGSPPLRQRNRSCSCSTTSNGRRSRPSCFCVTWSAAPPAAASSSSERTGTSNSRPIIRCWKSCRPAPAGGGRAVVVERPR